MSTAAKFLSVGNFPFCVTDISGTIPTTPHVDNLTLDQLMAFYWSLETFSITTTGTATVSGVTADGTVTFSINPLSSDKFDTAQGGSNFSSGFAWFGSTFGPSLFASCPAILPPRSRVCFSGSWTAGLLLDMEWTLSTDGQFSAFFSFLIGTDPSNLGKYRIYYAFEVHKNKTNGPTADIVWWYKNTAPFGGLSALTNGTIAIGGYTLNWWSYKTTGSSSTGGGMTATSSSYTY